MDYEIRSANSSSSADRSTSSIHCLGIASIPLRQPVSGGAVTLGTQLTSTFQVLPTCLRPTGGAVLDLSPASPTGAVQRIQAALAAAGAAIPGFGPADFGLQLLKTPEAIRFSTQSG